MKKLAMLLVAMLLMACGDGVTGPDTSDIPGDYVIYYHWEFVMSAKITLPPSIYIGDLILHDDRTLEIHLHTCTWDECQDDQGEGTWNRGLGQSGLRICSDPSIASTPWLYGLEVQDESCVTLFWEACCEGKSGTWFTRDLDPGQNAQRWLSIGRAVTVVTEEE